MLRRRQPALPVLAGTAVVLAGTFIALAAAASPAATPAGDAAVVCPLASPAATTCCPPSATTNRRERAIPCCYSTTAQPVCCPPNAACALLLTIGSSPNPSRAAQAVTVSGRLSRSGSGGTTITLWRRSPGASHFHPIARTTTDAAGNYKFRRVVDANRQWYVTGGGQRSPVDSQQVHARVSLHAGTSSGATGRRAVLTGSVRPGHNGEHVLIQRLIGAQWQTVAQARLRPPRHGRGSRFSSAVTLATSGMAKLRAELPGDSRNIASVSPTVIV